MLSYILIILISTSFLKTITYWKEKFLRQSNLSFLYWFNCNIEESLYSICCWARCIDLKKNSNCPNLKSIVKSESNMSINSYRSQNYLEYVIISGHAFFPDCMWLLHSMTSFLARITPGLWLRPAGDRTHSCGFTRTQTKVLLWFL